MSLWTKYDHERPDYDTYIKRMKKREVVDLEINKIEADKLELHTR